MKLKLTVTSRKRGVICRDEPYEYEELLSNPGFSPHERHNYLALLNEDSGIGIVEWERDGGTIMHIEKAT